MEKLIDLEYAPIKNNLKLLLKDKTTNKNIIFATNSYESLGDDFKSKDMITLEKLDKINLQPRVVKSIESQKDRTKKNGEVFTPSWICNQMNNHCDEEWFGRKDVFNIQKEQSWEVIEDKILFPKRKTWKQYILSKRIEITCGEAPYIVSRYDTSSGNIIPIKNRIGILDRKLRIINENIVDEVEWFKYVYKAFQSIYGYEFQGDNLLIARINLLMTFIEYTKDKWNREPNEEEIKTIIKIIIWNLWQMDGLTYTIPLDNIEENNKQLTLFNENKKEQLCIIYDWRTRKKIIFKEITKGDK